MQKFPHACCNHNQYPAPLDLGFSLLTCCNGDSDSESPRSGAHNKDPYVFALEPAPQWSFRGSL